jgi:pimeloyl-ACP methyl ester carboxylesterase
MLARDTGTPAALAFARDWPQLLDRAVLMNPHPPMSLTDDRTTFVAGVQKHLLRNPDLVATFAEFLRRQATTRLLERILDKALGEVAPDAAALKDPAVRQFLIRDIQALCARSVWGFACEHAVYADGWTPPRDLPPRPWTIALSTELPGHLDPAWLGVADLAVVRIEGAGVLPQFTHPEALAALFA